MKIVTDCAADMPASELQALGVTQAPLFINFPEGEVNSADLTADEFYTRLEAMRPAIPTTSQPSHGIFADLYQALAQSGEAILSLHISSGLSGTFQTARAVSEQLAAQVPVAVWDTLTLSGGERFQVWAAALAARAGWSLAALQQRLAEIRAATEVVYTLDTLEYLARGGRIGRVAALASSLLNIKPVIGVDHRDGKYNTLAKSRTLGRAVTTIAEHLAGQYGQTPLWVTVMHGRLGAMAEALSQELHKRLNIAKVEMLRVSPVLGVHTGPGIVGAAVVPLHLFEGL